MMKEDKVLYIHDMMHCSQVNCKLKDKCYRFFLGSEFGKHGHLYASWYMPNELDNDNKCEYYIDILNYTYK